MPFRLILASALLLIVLVAGLSGGGGLYGDAAVVGHFVGWRARYPDAAGALIFLTHLGGSAALIPAAAAAALATAARHRPAAIALLATVVGGRLLIELTKMAVGRPRPTLDTHPVYVFSQSFPSGHAGNTMITFGAIALIALPERWRAGGLVAAVTLSLLIGSTRPMLGVHWPSDVVGGWCLGLLWLLICWTLWERFSRSRT
ncbi:phosphatase PAP2 family protein [uncultured Sphingomonas sp.]|uniref:phosphatase PAP2 family protein n=1 Tax=uncultured Sphingomonas sp. TaxID=158754 RepID=UPI002600337D|nr:phosphatase PAP2 family protein [uncultured Sphingomonas sp.]